MHYWSVNLPMWMSGKDKKRPISAYELPHFSSSAPPRTRFSCMPEHTRRAYQDVVRLRPLVAWRDLSKFHANTHPGRGNSIPIFFCFRPSLSLEIAINLPNPHTIHPFYNTIHSSLFPQKPSQMLLIKSVLVLCSGIRQTHPHGLNMHFTIGLTTTQQHIGFPNE